MLPPAKTQTCANPHQVLTIAAIVERGAVLEGKKGP